jgi:nitroreductase
MDVLDAIKTRRSIRAYKPDPVPEDALMKVLEAARLAPSAGNRQPVLVAVVRNPAAREKLRQAYAAEWFHQAPIALVVCCFPGRAWTRQPDCKCYGDVDATIAMDHLILEAWEQGLGTCWIGAFDAEKAKEALNLPEGAEPIAMTPLGYPAEEPPAKPRKPLDEIVIFI